MANNKTDWDELGRNIEQIVNRAVKSHDYQKLNQTIRQTVEKAVNAGSTVRRTVTETRRQPKEVIVEKKLPALYGSSSGKMAVGIVKIVFGGIGLLGSAVAAVVSMLALLAPGTSAAPLVTALGALGGSGWLLGSGIRNVEYANRFNRYRKALGTKTHCALEQLARAVKKTEKFVRRELQKMTKQGLFREGHLDKEGSTFITSHETYRYFEQSRLQLEQRQQQEAAEQARKEALAAKLAQNHTPQVKEVLDRGDAYIAEIRRCNDVIPGQEISGKITRMEIIVEKIFDRAEAHPEVIPDLKKMMDYYLPMTVKLLNAYADMDAQPVQGETIRASKQEIEETLDTLNLAFENLLDDLFADTAMDISSDISVLQTLLAQEGLTEDELTRMKKTTN